MILSHKHKFIYIKTNKTASSSVEIALSQVCGPDDIITPTAGEFMAMRGDSPARNWRLEHPLVPRRSLIRRLLGRPERYYHPTVGYYEHMPAWRVKAYAGDEIWNSYFKFTFERNPWDRQISWWLHRTRAKKVRPEFEAFMTANKRKAYVNNWDLYTLDGKVAMDFVGRYENLSDDFDAVLKRLGLEGALTLPVSNTTDRGGKNYQSYYNERTRAMVADWYAPEIEYFGYTF
jgi:hypothetical protein